MILYFQTVLEKAKEASDATKKVVTEPSVFQQIIDLLEVIIWPLTVLLGLLFFKKHIGKVISSLGSIKAGAQGFEMNFIEDKLQEATKLIGIGSSGIKSKDGGGINPKDGGGINPKDGGGINPKDGGGINPKDGRSITPKRSHAETPYQELLELQDSINQKLKNIATQKGIAITGSSNFALTSELADHGIIKPHTARELKALIELNNLGLNSPKITYAQVTQMKQLFYNISF